MKIRIEKTLAFWVDAEINGIQIIQDPDASREELTRADLNEFSTSDMPSHLHKRSLRCAVAGVMHKTQAMIHDARTVG